MQDTAAGDDRRWRQDLDPRLRPHVLNKIVMKLAQIYHGQVDSTKELNMVACRFENKVFHEANSKEDYLRRISLKLVTLEQNQKQKQLQNVASVCQQQIQTGSHVQPFNEVHANHGANSSTAAISQVESMTYSQGGQCSHEKSLPMTHLGSGLVPNQHMAFPTEPNMHFNVKQEQLQVPGKPHQALQMQHINFSRCNPITPSAPGVQHSQQIIQSVAAQNPQHLAYQMQPTINFSTCYPELESIAQPQGQPLVQPTVQQNTLFRQNGRGTGMLPQEQMMVNQQGLGFNQQLMERKNYQMMVLQHANTAKMHNGHHGGQSSQAGARVGLQSTLKIHEQEALNEQIKMQTHPMAQPQQMIAVSQQNSLFSTMGSAGDVDWREEMFQQIKALKDAYLSELKELDQVNLVPKITKEQFESLPEDKADQLRSRVHLKQKTALMLKFLALEKNDIPDSLRGKLPKFLTSIQDLLDFYRRSKDRRVDARCKSQIYHGQHQITNLSGDQLPSCGSASHQNQQEQPVHSQLRENIICTTPAARQVSSSHLLGVASSCFPGNSQRSLQSSPTDKFQECHTTTPSPVIKSGIVNASSSSASLKSTSPSAITAPGATKAGASSSVSVKSSLPSPVATLGDAKVTSPCDSVNSTVPSAITDSASIQAASPCSSAKSTLPSPSAMSGVIEATAPVTNSGCAPVALACPSVQPTSYETDDIFSDLLLQDNSAAASAQAVVGETATQAEKDSREVAATKEIIPASPHQAETAGYPAEYNKHPGNELTVAKKPIDPLLDAVRASSPAMLTSAANCVYSVLNSSDWAPHGETDEFEDWAFFTEQGGSNTPNKMKRVFDTTSVLSESAQLGTFSAAENSAEHGAKRPKTKDDKDTVLDEINSANSMLIDTFISITDDIEADGIASSNGGTLIKLSYTATSLAPDLASFFATSGMSIVMPVKLLVPEDYPNSSPVIVCDKGEEEMRKSFCDISDEVDSAFKRTLRSLPEPMSVVDMARAWDASVRRAVVEFAKQHGGGTISSSCGEWASADGA